MLCLCNHCSLLFAESYLKALLLFTHVTTAFLIMYAHKVAWALCWALCSAAILQFLQLDALRAAGVMVLMLTELESSYFLYSFWLL